MNSELSTNKLINWQQQADGYLLAENYDQAIKLYEQGIASEPSIVSYYWYLGLALLLQGNEVEAQMTWMLPLAEGETEEVEQRTAELTQVLQTEAERQQTLRNDKLAWLIRQHIREINPEDLNNLLYIIQLSPSLNIYNDDEIPLAEVAQLFSARITVNFKSDLLLQTLSQALKVYPLLPSTFEFVTACISNTNNPAVLIDLLYKKASLFINYLSQEKLAEFTNICLQMTDINILVNLVNLYQNAGRNLESLKLIEAILSSSPTLIDEIAANYLTIRGLMHAGGYWHKAESAYQKYEILLNQVVESNIDVNPEHIVNLITTVAFAPYFKDEPNRNHQFRNQVAKFCQNRIRSYSNCAQELFQPKKISQFKVNCGKPLKIGYLSSCLRRHSVGWLSRWLFQHHDKEKFQIYAYSLEQSEDNLQTFISQQVSEFCDLSQTKRIVEIAEQIHLDEIDILIDLDSVTSRKVCGVMALKPAPIQITWLGSDASGLPAIDYFIADSYVLPEPAQQYYASKIWRLPNTYIAVDGFEVGVPTLRREQLNIPNNAIVYLTSQTPYKRHPETARLQIKILQEVPHSFLLIKGQNDQESIKIFFEKIAEQEGVDCSRLRFLPQVALEANHRANLAIADVVLDTYPYNGATTTLETLWMGVPAVTRVGEQFAARNSYTMMMNAGITEGIAWTDKEYIEWGIRLGKDAKLRQEVAWKLRQSRQTAPLWNAKQFTREMEKAYEQMWANYISAK